VLLYGRGFKKLNWVGGNIDIQAMDIFDKAIRHLTAL